jgi:hypothetical protein
LLAENGHVRNHVDGRNVARDDANAFFALHNKEQTHTTEKYMRAGTQMDYKYTHGRLGSADPQRGTTFG